MHKHYFDGLTVFCPGKCEEKKLVLPAVKAKDLVRKLEELSKIINYPHND